MYTKLGSKQPKSLKLTKKKTKIIGRNAMCQKSKNGFLNMNSKMINF